MAPAEGKWSLVGTRKLNLFLYIEKERDRSHTRKSWRATGAREEGVGWVWLVGEGYVTYTHLGEGSQLFWQRELFLVSDTHIRSERHIGHLLYHLIIFHIRSVVGRFDVSVQFLSQRTSFPP